MQTTRRFGCPVTPWSCHASPRDAVYRHHVHREKEASPLGYLGFLFRASEPRPDCDTSTRRSLAPPVEDAQSPLDGRTHSVLPVVPWVHMIIVPMLVKGQKVQRSERLAQDSTRTRRWSWGESSVSPKTDVPCVLLSPTGQHHTLTLLAWC